MGIFLGWFEKSAFKVQVMDLTLSIDVVFLCQILTINKMKKVNLNWEIIEVYKKCLKLINF